MQAKRTLTNRRASKIASLLPDAFDSALGLASALSQRAFGERVHYDSVLWKEVVRDLSDIFGNDAETILAEPALWEMEDRTRLLLESIRSVDPFRRIWAADSVLARCCYLVCRMTKPRVVVETGVAYGVSSAFMLRAMAENGYGALYSIDLAPPTRGVRRFRGIAVPDELRGRWTLHSGSSRRLLRPLSHGIGPIDIFLHDSLHTPRNMRREFAEVWPT